MTALLLISTTAASEPGKVFRLWLEDEQSPPLGWSVLRVDDQDLPVNTGMLYLPPRAGVMSVTAATHSRFNLAM